MPSPSPYTPATKATLSVTGTSSHASLGTQGTTLRISNAGTNPVFVRWGATTQTAVVTDFAVLAGESVNVSVQDDTLDVGAIAGTGTNAVYVSRGYGGL